MKGMVLYMEKRKVPTKNYIIMFLILVAVVFLTFYLAEWHKTIKEYYQNNSVMAEVLKPIESETISSYLLDNSDVVIYISKSNDQTIKNFEKKFKKYVLNNDFNFNVVYFDAKELEQEYINDLFIQYIGPSFNKFKQIVVPNLIYFSNGEIVDVLYVKENEITMPAVKKFMNRNSVIIDD